MSYRHNTVRKNELVFNVRDYGAKGDGIADDRSAIHAARDAAGVGGTLYFPPGTYRIQMATSGDPAPTFLTGGLRASVSGQKWLLGSAEIILYGTGRHNLITITAPNVSIVGGTLNMSNITGQYFWSAGIAILSGSISGNVYGSHGSGAAGAIVDGVTVNNAASYGVWAVATNSVTVTNCVMKNCFQSGITVIAGADTIQDILIDSNRIETTAKAQAAGIGVGANDAGDTIFDAGTRQVKHVRITNNSSVQPRGFAPGGINPGCIEAFNTQYTVIDGNTTDGGAFGITTGFMRRGVISNNACAGFHSYGIEVSGALEAVAVVGNLINADGAGGPYNAVTGEQDPAGTIKAVTGGIISAGTKSFKNYTIANNTISGFTTAARAGGISLVNVNHPSPGGNFENVAVTGNSISPGGGGINGQAGNYAAIAAGGPTTNLTVSGNVINGDSRTPSRGIDLVNDTHQGMSITGNNFSNLDSAANLDGTITDIRFTGNLVRNCGTGLTGNGVATATKVVTDTTSPLTSTATAAGTTTLTADSTEVQRFTGTATQTVVLPSTNVTTGRRFIIINSSTGAVTVQSSNTNTVATVAAGSSATLMALQATPTTSAHWHNLKV